MKGTITVDIALIVLIALILMAILLYSPTSPVSEAKNATENVTAGLVRIIEKPTIAEIGPDSCDSAHNCNYNIIMSGLKVKSNKPVDAAITMHFRGRDAVVATSQPLDGNEDTILDLSATFTDSYKRLPPVLRAPSSYNQFGKLMPQPTPQLLYDGQRLIMGDFVIDAAIRRFELVKEWIEKAEFKISCGDSSQTVSLAEGEIADIPMGGSCKGGSVYIDLKFDDANDPVSMTDPIRNNDQGDEFACISITTAGTPSVQATQENQPGDSVIIMFWKSDEQFRVECGAGGKSLDTALDTSYIFKKGELLAAMVMRPDCANHAMGGFSFTIPAKEWNPQGSIAVEEKWSESILGSEKTCSINY